MTSSIPTYVPPAQKVIAYCVTDHAGTVLAQQDQHRPFYAASTIKLHILAAALRAAEEGRLDLSSQVEATRTFTSVDGSEFTLAGDHLDPTHPAPGVSITVADLLVRMIDRSSNEATDHVLELVGLPAVAQTIEQWGLTGTRVERSIGDPAAVAAGLTNETTAADLAITVRTLVGAQTTGTGADADDAERRAPGRELARSALRAQRIRIITTAVPPSMDAGSKSGTVDRIRHDVAFVGDPNGPDVRYLAVLTQGYEEGEADAHIVDLARAFLAGVLPAHPEV